MCLPCCCNESSCCQVRNTVAIVDLLAQAVNYHPVTQPGTFKRPPLFPNLSPTAPGNDHHPLRPRVFSREGRVVRKEGFWSGYSQLAAKPLTVEVAGLRRSSGRMFAAMRKREMFGNATVRTDGNANSA